MLKILTFTALFCIIGCNSYHPSANARFAIGSRVKVIHGFYENCVGNITREWYSIDRIDRNGVLHPAAFAGYYVNVDCNDQKGERTFTPDFLVPVK